MKDWLEVHIENVVFAYAVPAIGVAVIAGWTENPKWELAATIVWIPIWIGLIYLALDSGLRFVRSTLGKQRTPRP